MITPTKGLGGLPPVIKPQAYGTGMLPSARAQASPGQFDQVNISQTSTRESQFFQTLVSRLSGEIRTANTTGVIAQVKEQVRSGSYLPDPVDIAARLLLRGESSEDF